MQTDYKHIRCSCEDLDFEIVGKIALTKSFGLVFDLSNKERTTHVINL